MSNFVADDDLKAWITDLRARLERGEFADTPPVDLGYGTGPLPADGTIRIMLADLDRFRRDDARGDQRLAQRRMPRCPAQTEPELWGSCSLSLRPKWPRGSPGASGWPVSGSG